LLQINTSQLLAVNRPETVLQLARMFSEASALHDAEQHRQRCRQQQQQQQQLESRSGPSTPVRPPTGMVKLFLELASVLLIYYTHPPSVIWTNTHTHYNIHPVEI
jgi:hypothetical protein